MQDFIDIVFEEQANNLLSIRNSDYVKQLEKAIQTLIICLKNSGKILLAGNGGSAADAQHFAGEIVGRFLKERKSLPAISLCTDPSVVTCIANDYGYDELFARQVEGLGNSGDVFIGISTSGNSQNIINAITKAKEKNILTIAILGKDGGKIKDICDYSLVVPLKSTPRIQEVHTMTVHIMCEAIEKEIFK